MANIVVAGSLNMDVVGIAPRIPAAGETILGTRYFTSPGGKGANQAYAAAKLATNAPGTVAMLGRVGDDDFGRAMRKNLADVGCDVSGVRTVPGPSGVALIFVSDAGENSIVVAPGANNQFHPGDVAADSSCMNGAAAVLLQLETPLETVLAAAQLAKHAGARVLLDPAPAPAAGLPAGLLHLTDILTPNETEAALLAGGSHDRFTAEHARSVAVALRKMGARSVILKLGARGCLLLESEEPVFIPAPRVEAVDTTAAGDVFNAGLGVGLSEGLSLLDACFFAVQAASLSVTKLGAQSSAPSRAEVEAFRRAR